MSEASTKTKINLKNIHLGSIKTLFRFRIAPRKQFTYLIVFIIIVLISSSAFHIFLFRNVLSSDVFSIDTPATPIQTVDEKKLENVLDRFSEREALRGAILVDIAIPVDPGK